MNYVESASCSCGGAITVFSRCQKCQRIGQEKCLLCKREVKHQKSAIYCGGCGAEQAGPIPMWQWLLLFVVIAGEALLWYRFGPAVLSFCK